MYLNLQIHHFLLHRLSIGVEVTLLYSKSTFSSVKDNTTIIIYSKNVLAETVSIQNSFIQPPLLNLYALHFKPGDSDWVITVIRKGYELNWKSAPTAADIMAWRFLSSRLPKQQPLALSTARKTWLMLSLSCRHN